MDSGFWFSGSGKISGPFSPQENRAKGPRLSRGLQGRRNPAPHPVAAAPDTPSWDAYSAATPWTATSLSFTAGLAFQKPNPVIFTVYHTGFRYNTLQLQGEERAPSTVRHPRWKGRKNRTDKWKFHRNALYISNRLTVNAEGI